MTLIYTILLTTALYFIGSRAKITAPIRAWYPRSLARFMDCAMCSGAWYGLIVSFLALGLGYHYSGLEDFHAPFVCFFGSAVWTPIGAGLVEAAFYAIGTRADLVDLVDKEYPFEGPSIVPNTPPICPTCKSEMAFNGAMVACPRCDVKTFDVDPGRP